MFTQLFNFILGYVIAGVTTEDSCNKLKAHPNFHLVHSDDDCGQVKINQDIGSRILNGVTAKPGTMPWMAHIVIQSGRGVEQCGGSVINEHYVLTAAHCFDGHYNMTITVVLGLHDRKRINNGLAKIYKVAKHVIHPKYSDISVKNDIALLRLNGSIDFESPYVNYVCLPTSCELFEKTFLVGDNLTIAGWGLTPNGTFSTTLQKVVVPVKKCRSYGWSGGVFSAAPSQLCAGGGVVMGCSGDSGGPLIYETAERVVQVGILSFGPSDCSAGSDRLTEFYSRVSSFVGWILDNLEA